MAERISKLTVSLESEAALAPWAAAIPRELRVQLDANHGGLGVLPRTPFFMAGAGILDSKVQR